jgi:L-serine dehydratase
MAISTFDLFKIGIGPSSSHTVGPMRAANLFVAALREGGVLAAVKRVRCALYGSLGATGKGHGSDKAVMLGLEGEEPDGIDPDCIADRLQQVRDQRSLKLGGEHAIGFDEREDLLFLRRETLPFHPNGMRLAALGEAGQVLLERTYYSVGGGFVVNHDESGQAQLGPDTRPLPHPFRTGDELLQQCGASGLGIARLMWRNELAWRSEDELRSGLRRIWQAMQSCVKRGIATEGTLPGGFKVRRRAADLYRGLTAHPEAALKDPLQVMDWVNLYALAVNEENAAGGRVVTAPTNGAAGIVPAVLHYYHHFIPGASEQGVFDFLLTAAAIAILYKENASISGAEVGCQGEVGVACSMAAGALCAVMGGTPEQVENAAEIGMEHHLGLTCDPVGGLVQIPCIERNAIASVKAINAARMALRGDGTHHVSLDKVIKTMRETGADMKTKYKETSRGGLAVNVVEC